MYNMSDHNNKHRHSVGSPCLAPLYPFLLNVEGGGGLGFLKTGNVAGPTSSNILSSRICPFRLNIEIGGQGGDMPPSQKLKQASEHGNTILQ